MTLPEILMATSMGNRLKNKETALADGALLEKATRRVGTSSSDRNKKRPVVILTGD